MCVVVHATFSSTPPGPFHIRILYAARGYYGFFLGHGNYNSLHLELSLMLLYSPGAAEEGERERGAEIEPVLRLTELTGHINVQNTTLLIKVVGGLGCSVGFFQRGRERVTSTHVCCCDFSLKITFLK